MEFQWLLVFVSLILIIPSEPMFKTVPIRKTYYLRKLARYRPYRFGGGNTRAGGVREGLHSTGFVSQGFAQGSGFFQIPSIGRRYLKPVRIVRQQLLTSKPRFISRISRQLSQLPHLPAIRCPKHKVLACSEYKKGNFKRLCLGKCHGKSCIRACGCVCLHKKELYPKKVENTPLLLPVNRNSLIPFCRTNQFLRCTANPLFPFTNSVQCSRACADGVCPSSCNCQCVADRSMGVGLSSDIFRGGSLDVSGVGMRSGINDMLSDAGLNNLDLNSLDLNSLATVDSVGIGSGNMGVGEIGLSGLPADGIGGLEVTSLGIGGLDNPDSSLSSLDVPDLSLPTLDFPDPDFPSIDNGVGVALAGGGFVGVGPKLNGGRKHRGKKMKPVGTKEITETVDVKINVTTNGGKKDKKKGGAHDLGLVGGNLGGGAGSGLGGGLGVGLGGGLGDGLGGGFGGGLGGGKNGGLGVDLGGGFGGRHSGGLVEHGGGLGIDVGVLGGGLGGGLDGGLSKNGHHEQGGLGTSGVFENGQKVGLITPDTNAAVTDPTFIMDPTRPKHLPREPIPIIPAVGGLDTAHAHSGVAGNGLLLDSSWGLDLNGMDPMGGIPLHAQGQGPVGNTPVGLGRDLGNINLDLSGLGNQINQAMHPERSKGNAHGGIIDDAFCMQTGEKLWCDVHKRWNNTPGLSNWCNSNCPTGSCDRERCNCSCVSPSVYDSKVTSLPLR